MNKLIVIACSLIVVALLVSSAEAGYRENFRRDRRQLSIPQQVTVTDTERIVAAITFNETIKLRRIGFFVSTDLDYDTDGPYISLWDGSDSIAVLELSDTQSVGSYQQSSSDINSIAITSGDSLTIKQTPRDDDGSGQGYIFIEYTPYIVR